MDKDLQSYRNQLASNPDDAEALARLESALVRTHDWAGLVALTAERAADLSEEEAEAAWLRLVESLEQHVATLDDPAAASQLALQLGRVWQDRLIRPDEAMLRYQRAFQLDTSNTEALHLARASYIRRENWDLVWQLYNLELEAVAVDPEAQAELLFEMADLCVNRLDRQGDAARCVRQAVKLAPDHPRQAEFGDLLDSVHRDREGRFEELRQAAEATRDPRQRAGMLVDAASLWMEEAPDDARIEGVLKEVLSADPRNENARQLLQAYYEANGLWDELTSYLVGRAEASARKADRLTVYQRLATIAQHQVKDPEKAVEWHREVLKLSPTEQDSLRYCVDYYSDNERWHDLVGIYEAALRTRHRGGDESAMLVQIAMILWRKVKDLEQAESYFKRIKLNDPKNGLMLQFYSEFYAARKDWKRLLGTLAARQGNEDSTERKVDLGLEMARVAEEELGNQGKAIDIWKSVLKLDETHEPAREALRRLFFETRKWNALLELLKEDISLVPDGDVGRTVEILNEMIGIYRDQLNLPVMVINTYNQILQVDPTNGEALDALQQKYESSARWNDLIGVLKRRAEAAQESGDEDQLVGLYRQIAQLWLEKFSNPNQAIEYLEGVLELRPADEATIGQLVEIYKHRKDWAALFTTYRRQIELLEGEERTERLVEMARIAANRLDQKDDAIELWRAVTDADERRDEPWQALESLYQKTKRWEDLASLFEAQAGRQTDEAEQLSWLKKLAAVYAERLDDEERASETWRAVLRVSPRDLHAESYLRELYLLRSDWNSLETLYGERGDWEAFIRLLSGAADASDDVATRVDLYKRMARVCAVSLENEDAAVECWERILVEDGDNLDAARTLAPHYERAEAWEPLVGVYEVLLRNEPEDPQALMEAVAGVYDAHLGAADEAYEWYARSLQADPSREDLLEHCARTAAAAERHEGLADLLELVVGSVEPPEAEVRVRRVLAATCAEQLGRSADAAEHYERIRALAGDSDDVLAALADLYQKLGDWARLNEVYQAQLDRADEPSDQVVILAAIGELQENVSDDAGAARDAYERLRELDPDNVDALRGLQRLAERSEDVHSLAEYVAAELALTTDSGDRASLLYRLGQLTERLGDLEEAVRHYASVLELEPEHTAAVQALESCLDTEVAPDAARVLEPYMRRHEQWSSLRRCLELEAEGAANRAHAVKVLHEVADIRENKLSDARGAFETFKRILIEDRTDDPARDGLERIAGSLGVWEELAELFARFAFAGDLSDEDVETNAQYSHRLARLQEEQLGAYEDARLTLEMVQEEVGDDLKTLGRLDGICTRLEDWPGLVAICERRLALLEAPAERAETLFRMGDLHEVFLEDPDAAVETYRRVLADDPVNLRAVESLERIFRNVGRFEDLADLLRDRIDGAEGEARVPLAFQLGQVLQGPLSAPADALERFAEVLELAPDHEPAERALEDLVVSYGDDSAEHQALRARACDVLEPIYAERDDWEAHVRVLEVRLRDAQTPADRVGLHVRIAQLHEGAGENPGAAFGCYADALRVDFGNAELLAELERLARAQGAWDALSAVLREGLDDEERAASMDPVLRREMLARVARLHETELADTDTAVFYNELLLEEEPEDPGALESLDRLYLRRGEVESLVGVLERRVEGAAEPKERADLCFRLGELYESGLGDTPRAVEVYARIRAEVDPTDLRAHVALERLYATQGDYQSLVEVLRDHAEQSDGTSEKKQLLTRAAATLEHALERPEDAVEAHREVAELDPEDTQALAHLDRLYGQLERWLDLLEVLEKQRALASEDAGRNTFDYRMGVLLRDHLGESERAVKSFQAVLERNPDHVEARVALERMLDEPEVRLDVARILVPLYENAEAWRPLRDTLRGTLDDLDDVEAKVDVLQRIALIEEGYLDDGRAAFESLAEGYRLSDASPELEAELCRLADELDLHLALADLLAEMAAFAAERAAQIHALVARLAEERLDDAERAISEHRAVLDSEPESPTALDALERLYTRTEDHAALVEILERKVELAAEADQPALLGRVARIQELHLDDPVAAVETWRRRLALNEADDEAAAELERLLGEGERWPELAALLDLRASVVEEGAARAEVEYRLGRVCEQHLGEGPRALDLYRAVLEAVPEHQETRAALAGLFGDEAAAAEAGVEPLQVVALLEPLYRADEDFPALVLVLEARQAALLDDPAARVEVLREIGQLHETRLGDPVGAFETCGRILAVIPEDARNRQDLHRLGELTQRFDELAERLEDAAGAQDDPETKVGLLLELGLVEETWRGNAARARDTYRDILEIDPEHKPAMQALVSLFTTTHAWEELVELHLDRAAQTVDVEEQKDLYFKVCQLLVDVVDDPGRAIDTHRKVLEVDPGNAEAFKALERFLTQEERWADLADLLRDEIEFAEDDGARAALRTRLAEVLETRLDDLGGAIEAWRVALQEDQPGYQPAVDALERLLIELDAEPPDPLRRRVAELLEPLYEGGEAWSDWVMAVEAQLLYMSDRWQRVETLTRIAQVQERQLHAPAQAFEAYARAFEADYGNPDLQTELDRLGADLAAWSDLVRTYLNGIEQFEDLDAAVEILLKVAALFDEKLSDRERAIETWRRVLLVDDSNQVALGALERALQAENRHQDLVGILNRKADLAADSIEKKEILYRVCEIWEQVLDRPDQAIDTYRRVFEEDPEDQNAIEALIRLYETTAQWVLLVEVLREKLEVETDEAGRKVLHFRIARTYEEQIQDVEETILSYRSVLELDPLDTKALEALERLYSREGRWGELIDLLEGQRDQLKERDPERVEEIELHIADVLQRQLAQVAQAIELYGEILERNPASRPARGALESLLADRENRLTASRVLEPHYERQGDPEALARIYELQLLDLDDRAERLELLKRLAKLRYEVLKHPPAAFDAYCRAFREDPADPEIGDALHELADELKAHEELAALFLEQAQEALDPEVARVLNRWLARIYDQRLGRHDDAVVAWQAVMAADPYDVEALAALDRLYQAAQNWGALIDVLRRRIEVGGGEEADALDLRFRLGYLLEVVEADLGGAIELYRSILWEKPDHAYGREAMERLAVNREHRQAIAEVLEPIYSDAEQWDKLAILTEMRIELAPGARDRAQLWLRSAEIREGRLGDADSAFEAVLNAFDEVPQDPEVREQMVRIATERGAWERLVGAFEAAQGKIEDLDLRIEDHLKVADWCRGRLRDDARAERHYLAALDVDDANDRALEALERLYESNRQWDQLADILRRKADLLFDLDEKKARLTALGELCADKLQDVSRAVAAYEEVLGIDDGDATALGRLEALHAQAEDWSALYEVLLRRSETVYDGDELARVHRRMGDLARVQLGEPERAAEAYEKVLELDPDAFPVMKALQEIYEASERWDRLQEALVKQLSTVDEGGAERMAVLRALGRNADARLGDSEAALEYYRQVFLETPGDADTLAALERLYAQTTRWYDLVEALRAHSEVLEEGSDRLVPTLVRLASVAEQHLQDVDLAIETLNRVRENEPNHAGALTVLARLYERAGEWEKTAETLELAIENAGEGSERAEAWRRLGLLYRDRLDRTDEARRAFEAAVAEGEDAEALDALVALAREAGDDATVAALLQKRLSGAEGEARVGLLLEIAELREKTGDAAGSVEALEEAWGLDQERLEVADRLLEAYLDADRHDDAEPILAGVIEKLKGARRFKELFAYNYRMGRVAEARGDEEGALAAYTACFDYDATYLPNLLKLGALHFKREEWDQALKIFQTVLLHQMKLEKHERVDVFYRLGQVRMALGDERKAKDMFNRALGLDPDHAAAREAKDALG